MLSQHSNIQVKRNKKMLQDILSLKAEQEQREIEMQQKMLVMKDHSDNLKKALSDKENEMSDILCKLSKQVVEFKTQKFEYEWQIDDLWRQNETTRQQLKCVEKEKEQLIEMTQKRGFTPIIQSNKVDES